MSNLNRKGPECNSAAFTNPSFLNAVVASRDDTSITSSSAELCLLLGNIFFYSRRDICLLIYGSGSFKDIFFTEEQRKASCLIEVRSSRTKHYQMVIENDGRSIWIVSSLSLSLSAQILQDLSGEARTWPQICLFFKELLVKLSESCRPQSLSSFLWLCHTCLPTHSTHVFFFCYYSSWKSKKEPKFIKKNSFKLHAPARERRWRWSGEREILAVKVKKQDVVFWFFHCETLENPKLIHTSHARRWQVS